MTMECNSEEELPIKEPQRQRETHISDLSLPILTDILSRLPTKTAASICKFVSKSWCNIISDPMYTAFHSMHAPTFLLLREYSVQLEYKDNFRLFLDVEKQVITSSSHEFEFPSMPHFALGNSCNGLVSVCGPPSRDPVYVWNPMLGECVALPGITKKSAYKVMSGIGYNPNTNEYKVIRVFCSSNDQKWEAEVYTLGSSTWRSIGSVPYLLFDRSPPAFLNRALHWIVYSPGSVSIFSFDFETEKFLPLPGPPAFFKEQFSGSSNICKNTNYYCSNIGVIEGCLYICATDRFSLNPEVEIWIMKKYGVTESWTKVLAVKSPSVEWWNLKRRHFQLINIGRDGEILLLCGHSHLLCYNPRDRSFKQLLEEKGTSVAAHVPSFVSLKDFESATCQVLTT